MLSQNDLDLVHDDGPDQRTDGPQVDGAAIVHETIGRQLADIAEDANDALVQQEHWARESVLLDERPQYFPAPLAARNRGHVEATRNESRQGLFELSVTTGCM